jgi:hypothetical protein
MVETCCHCGALFTVSCIGGNGICGACLEPIDCPYCKKTVRQERTTGTFTETLVKAPDSALAQYLGITDDEWNDMGAELNANTSRDDMVYSYWFEVPEGTPEDLLEKTGWKVDQMIDDIPVWVVDCDEPDMANFD